MDDKAIIELFTKRHEEAITATDKQYGRYCRHIAFQILHNTDDTEDCVNEAYWRIWNAIPPAQPSDLRLYLGKIVRNIAIHICEKQSAAKRGNGQYALALDELLECIPSRETSETITDTIVIQNTLNHFLDSLTITEKTIFLRRYWYLDSIPIIANQMHMTHSNVYVVLHRTRQKLRNMLEKEGIVI